MEFYKIGDTVKLKSGGPVMVIHGQRNDDHFECVWLGNNSMPHSKIFNSKVLVPFDPS